MKFLFAKWDSLHRMTIRVQIGTGAGGIIAADRKKLDVKFIFI